MSLLHEVFWWSGISLIWAMLVTQWITQSRLGLWTPWRMLWWRLRGRPIALPAPTSNEVALQMVLRHDAETMATKLGIDPALVIASYADLAAWSAVSYSQPGMEAEAIDQLKRLLRERTVIALHGDLPLQQELRAARKASATGS